MSCCAIQQDPAALPDAPQEFTVSPDSLENVKTVSQAQSEQRGTLLPYALTHRCRVPQDSISSIPDFKITGKLHKTNCAIDKPFTGEVSTLCPLGSSNTLIHFGPPVHQLVHLWPLSVGCRKVGGGYQEHRAAACESRDRVYVHIDASAPSVSPMHTHNTSHFACLCVCACRNQAMLKARQEKVLTHTSTDTLSHSHGVLYSP